MPAPRPSFISPRYHRCFAAGAPTDLVRFIGDRSVDPRHPTPTHPYLLCGSPRSAGLRSTKPSTLLVWEPDEFRRLLLGNPDFCRQVFGRALRMLIDKEHELIASLVRTGRHESPGDSARTETGVAPD